MYSGGNYLSCFSPEDWYKVSVFSGKKNSFFVCIYVMGRASGGVGKG